MVSPLTTKSVVCNPVIFSLKRREKVAVVVLVRVAVVEVKEVTVGTFPSKVRVMLLLLLATLYPVAPCKMGVPLTLVPRSRTYDGWPSDKLLTSILEPAEKLIVPPVFHAPAVLVEAVKIFATPLELTARLVIDPLPWIDPPARTDTAPA